MEQFFRDQKELEQIKAEEKRLQAAKVQAAVESEKRDNVPLDLKC